jgi:hypothetical protein
MQRKEKNQGKTYSYHFQATLQKRPSTDQGVEELERTRMPPKGGR